VIVYGTPNARRDNLVLVCHALTGNSRVAEWWPALLAEGGVFDTRKWCVIGAYLPCHPELVEGATVQDIVAAQRQATRELGFEQFQFVIGGSLGGMQALTWALDAPERVDHAIIVGAHDHHSAMGIALNAVQRDAIALDSVRGLGLARKIAMLSYKSEELLNARHNRKPDRNNPSRFDIEGYLDLQARRFVGRIDAETYVARTHAMDSFDVRHRAGETTPELTFVGISSDWLFRTQDVRAAATRFSANYLELESDHGHDAFLAEAAGVSRLLERTVAPQRSSNAGLAYL
jgi:homoserine O-acetyltransferase/O-succinyltransferase